MVKAVDHINIVVSDLERSVSFYTDVLGFKETKRALLQGDWIEHIVGLKDVQAEVVYINSSPRIELLHYTHPNDGLCPNPVNEANTIGLRHIAFRVETMEAIVERLKNADIHFFSDPVSVPEQTVTHEAGRKKLCYFRDPDGVILELAEYT